MVKTTTPPDYTGKDFDAWRRYIREQVREADGFQDAPHTEWEHEEEPKN